MSEKDYPNGLGFAAIKQEGAALVLGPMTYKEPEQVIVTGAKYVVTSNNPYYPSVEYFLTLDAAQAYANSILKDKEDDEGSHDCIISVCEVLDSRKVKALY
jgi:hypothetical protein